MTDEADKAAKLESARRFCDLMEEEEDISLAQSVAACRELAQLWVSCLIFVITFKRSKFST